METYKKQIIELTFKIDQLHRSVEQIKYQVNSLCNEKNLKPFDNSLETGNYNLSPCEVTSAIPTSCLSIEHKDILQDNRNYEKIANNYTEIELSPEVQIRRLTAQLTAAYNRIATLEEQLFACRISS